MNLIECVETVEVPTDNTSKLRFYFSEYPNIRDKNVINIYTYRVLKVSKSPMGKALVNNTVFYNSFLVLSSKNNEVINRIPLYRITGETYYTMNLIINHVIDWPKSYVEISNNSSLSASETFLFSIYCSDIPKKIPKISGLNVEILEVKTTPTTITKFMFPDNDNLRNKIIHRIEHVTLVAPKTPSDGTIVNGTVKEKSYLTVSSKGDEILKRIPLRDFDPYNYFGFEFVFSFIPDLPKCYVECVDTTDLVEDQVYMFYLFFYDKIIRR
ncbi:hypothetical protein ES705_06380 [subsurface metagenome]